jgi:hypothetical protein
MEKVVKVSLFTVFNGAIIRSPVGSPDLWVTNVNGTYEDYISVHGYPKDYVGGQFRANWRMDLNRVDDTVIDSESKAVAMLSLKQGIDHLKIGDTAYFTNPMPYGQRLEYDGWSTQAPDGIVRVEQANFKRNVNKAIRATRT